jgi:hypothetical protein
MSAMDRSLQLEIGRLLRDSYSEVTVRPAPERFIKLIQALEGEEV